MKKVYRLFTAAVMFIAGVTGVSARHWNYDFSTPVGADDIQPNVTYALQAGFSVTGGSYHFLAGEGFSRSSNLTIDNVYTFEPVEGKTDKSGKQVYYLKNKLGYVAVPGNGQFYTNQLERAWQIVVKTATPGDAEKTYEHTGRNKADTEDSIYTYTGLNAYIWEAKDAKDPSLHDFSTLTFNPVVANGNALVIVSATSKDQSDEYSLYDFLLTYPNGQENNGTAARATNYTRNAWYIYTTAEMTARDGLDAVVKELTDGVDLVEKLKNYKLGAGVGEYSQEKYDALMTIWQRIKAIQEGGTATDEEMDQLANGLKPAYETFVTSGKGLEEGYYILTSWRAEQEGTDYDHGAIYDGSAIDPSDKAVLWTWNGTSRLRRPGFVRYDKEAPLDYKSVKFIWQVIADTENPGLFFFKNLDTGKYIGYVNAQNTPLPVTDEAEASYNIVANPNQPGFFSFYSPKLWKNPGAQYGGIHCAGDYEAVVAWDWRTGGSSWHVRTITKAELDALLASIEQPKRNDAMKALVEKAENALVKGKAYMAVDKNNQKIEKATTGEVYEVDGLVTSSDQLACPMNDPEEGADINNFLDNNLETYYHSTWRSGEQAWPGAHYLQIKLEEAEQALLMKWIKRAGNNNNGAPSKITLWGTNDESKLELNKEVVEGEDNTQVTNYNAWKTAWDSVAVAKFEYPYDVVWGENNNKKNAAGTAYFDLGKPYKYIRMEVVTRVNNGNVPSGNKFFHGAEMRLYKAAYDKAASLIESVPKAVVDKLNAAIGVAKTELGNSAATQASLEALQAAYDEFLQNYPEPTRVSDAIAEAKAVEAAAEEGAELGYYKDGAKAAYKAVIEKVENDLNNILKTAQPNVEQINNMLAELNAGSQAFADALKIPETGIYVLRSNTTVLSMTRRGLYVPNSSTKHNVKMAGRVKDEANVWGDDANFKNKLGAYWKVEKVEGGYTYQNLFTGLYLAPEGKKTRIVTQRETPYVFAIRFAKEPGCFNVVAQKDDVPQGHVYLNAEESSANLVLWNTASGRDNSAFIFETADPSELLGDRGFVYDLQHMTNPQIMTFPIAIDQPENFYTVIGQDASNNIQLAKVTGNLEAGQAYVYIPETDNKDKFITLYSVVKSANELKPTHVAAEPVNGLVPTFEETVVPVASGRFNSDHSKVLLSEVNEKVAANTGYFTVMPETTETGATAIVVNGKITTIGGVVWGGKAANSAVYTISGVRVKNAKNLPAGLYIVNGKKQIVK